MKKIIKYLFKDGRPTTKEIPELPKRVDVVPTLIAYSLLTTIVYFLVITIIILIASI